MSIEETEHSTTRLYWSIGKVATEKMESLLSKMSDDTATQEDRLHAAILQEITALAKNRLSVEENETGFEKGSDVWVERTSESHFPHIRLHGGALEDDPILD
ncbi:hypothetical protein EKD00_06975 [Chlorobium phaeovibrioides]|uniref:Uncharacterized protein n=2 Tax=Chlorobium phaeovibrioides TaxID=1094 RepID=A0A3S0NJ93_CHLPH|nr:hypothetical protein [Chlorobium phaeovibrioides]HCD36351.1 hypothetical protein [Chlorobium sp.]KAA6232228.1 hypothetical protein FP507_03300 [Chlorobium phaeovibrioides]MWV54910.1 hypothetical protein [Chlorobium phaeovibrioides]QEQ57267.1 hypothetical protein FNV82_06630 [Chlorobium phaeovibrioides]RTY34811.1 hypothetical protein EKD00_06975 [Chlorobium phaeovibrioides]